MVLKRWSFILVAAWLINVLVCFHASDVFESAGNTQSHNSGYHACDNSLIDIVFNHFFEKKENQKDHRKIAFRKRFVNSRAADYNLELPAVAIWLPRVPVELVLFDPISFGQKLYFLSPHYHYLFRLSPF